MSPSLLFSQPITNLVRNKCRSAPNIKMDKAAGELHLKIIPKISPEVTFLKGFYSEEVYKTGNLSPLNNFSMNMHRNISVFPEESNFELSKKE